MTMNIFRKAHIGVARKPPLILKKNKGCTSQQNTLLIKIKTAQSAGAKRKPPSMPKMPWEQT